MRPTQYSTRKQLIDEHVLNIDEDTYNVCFGEDAHGNGDDIPDAMEPALEEEDSDGGDQSMFNDEEVDDALKFLSR